MSLKAKTLSSSGSYCDTAQRATFCSGWEYCDLSKEKLVPLPSFLPGYTLLRAKHAAATFSKENHHFEGPPSKSPCSPLAPLFK